MRASWRRAWATSSAGVISCAGAIARGSRRACDVTQFWQLWTAAPWTRYVLVLLDLDVVDGPVVGEDPRVLEPALAEAAVRRGLEEVELGGDRRRGNEERGRGHAAGGARGDQELVLGRGADLRPAGEGERHHRPAVVMAEDAAHRARAPAVRDHVHLGAHGHRVVRRLQHRRAALEQRVERARPARRRDLRPRREAVAAVVVAAEHAEGEGARAGEGVEERLLLHRVQLQGADVTEGDTQRPRLVEADAADAVATGRDQAAMPAGEAADAARRAASRRARLRGCGATAGRPWATASGASGSLSTIRVDKPANRRRN